jgi:hypothetical protein
MDVQGNIIFGVVAAVGIQKGLWIGFGFRLRLGGRSGNRCGCRFRFRLRFRGRSGNRCGCRFRFRLRLGGRRGNRCGCRFRFRSGISGRRYVRNRRHLLVGSSGFLTFWGRRFFLIRRRRCNNGIGWVCGKAGICGGGSLSLSRLAGGCRRGCRVAASGQTEYQSQDQQDG